MKVLSEQLIRNLNISPVTCIEWVKESLAMKSASELPVKMSVHPGEGEFFTTMPCLLPPPDGENPYQGTFRRQYFGVKVVHRLLDAVPSLGSKLLLYDARTGELLALIDADWITAMRTGALAAAASKALRKQHAKTYGFMGLGNTARAALTCILEQEPEMLFHVKLLRYKHYEDDFCKRFEAYSNVSFSFTDDVRELVQSSDVFFSCITHATGNIVEDISCFRPGITLIPIHTQGFMNCDTVFDRILGDDTKHVSGFRYFNQFRDYNEIGEVFAGRDPGRTSDNQRIIQYSYGLAIHDIVFAAKIFEQVEKQDMPQLELYQETRKFWL